MSKKDKATIGLGELKRDMVRPQGGNVTEGQPAAQFTVKGFKKPDFAAIGDNAMKLSEEMKSLAGEIAAAVASRRDAMAQIDSCGDDDLAREIAESLAEEKTAVADAYIDEQLACNLTFGGKPIPRRCAMIAFVNAIVPDDFGGDVGKAREVLLDLEGKRILVRDDRKGHITLGAQRYNVPDHWGMTDRLLGEFRTRVAKLGFIFDQPKAVHKDTRPMEERADTDLATAMKTGRGMCLLNLSRRVPRTDRDGKPKLGDHGKTLYEATGMMVVEFGEGYVRPVQGNGQIEKRVGEMIDMGVEIPVSSLSDRKRLNVGHQLQQQEFYYFLDFWKYCIRGLETSEADQLLLAQKEAFKGKATITVEQALGLNGLGGKIAFDQPAFWQYHGQFTLKVNGQRINDLYFLATMVMRGDNPCIMVNEVPEHVLPLLGEYVGKTFDISDHFRAVPYAPVLRAIRGQVAQALTIDHAVIPPEAGDEEPSKEEAEPQVHSPVGA